jgi:hypothetical protein
LPIPDAPEVMLIQVVVGLTVAVHAQSGRVVTLTVCVPPEDGIWGLVGDTVYVHGPT